MAVSTATSAPAKNPGPKDNIVGARQAYYDKIDKYDMAPLWEVLKNYVTKEPKPKCAPMLWKFEDAKKLVMEAGDVITAEEAERRVLVLENPALRGQARATNTLFAGIQLILPGEIAEVHRHVSSAIRFVLDGQGAYTAVEGEKTIMSPGDFVITANWAPHDHGNTSEKPMIALRGVRISWLTLAMKFDFAADTRSASRRAATSSSSVFFHGVRSRKMAQYLSVPSPIRPALMNNGIKPPSCSRPITSQPSARSAVARSLTSRPR